MILEWVSVFLVGVSLGLSVAILVVLWRVWDNTDRAEQDGRERLQILREQQERLAHLREERRVLLEELERLREQKERLQWLREGRAALLAELKRLRSLVAQEKRAGAPTSAPAEQPPVAAMGDRHNGHAVANGHMSSVEGAMMPDESAALGPATHPRHMEAREATERPQGEAESARSLWVRIFGRRS